MNLSGSIVHCLQMNSQGNRVSFSLRDEADEEVVVPGCDFAFEAHGVFGW